MPERHEIAVGSDDTGDIELHCSCGHSREGFGSMPRLTELVDAATTHIQDVYPQRYIESMPPYQIPMSKEQYDDWEALRRASHVNWGDPRYRT